MPAGDGGWILEKFRGCCVGYYEMEWRSTLHLHAGKLLISIFYILSLGLFTFHDRPTVFDHADLTFVFPPNFEI